MTSPDRARAVAELDALTDQLPARVGQLARRLDRVIAHHRDPGVILNGRRWIDGKPVCPTCLAKTCDCPVQVHQPPAVVVVNGGVCQLDGPTDEPQCVWCRETAGTCTLTAGSARCEGTHEMYANALATAAAPRITIPFRAGGC